MKFVEEGEKDLGEKGVRLQVMSSTPAGPSLMVLK